MQLQTGLSALKRKDYPAAIEHLEAVCQTATDIATLSKAQMGLVKAYAQTGGVNAATALCRSLLSNSNSQVSGWATRTLQELSRRAAPPAEIRPTESPTSKPSSPASDGIAADTTGFVPFQPSPTSGSRSAASQSSDATGFTPFNTSPDGRRSNAKSSRDAVQDEEKVDLAAYLSSADRVEAPADEAEPAELVDEEAEDLAAYVSDSIAADPEPIAEVNAPNEPDEAVLISEPSDTFINPRSPAGQAAKTPSRHQPSIASIPWRQAGRAQKWSSLGKVDLSKLWGLQLLTVVLLVGLVLALVRLSQSILNGVLFFLSWIPFVRSIRWHGEPFWSVIIPLGILLIAAPWLLHWILQRAYRLEAMSLERLETISPESIRLLKRVCNQKQRSIPQLGLVPTTAPLLFTYGYLPQNTWIVVSQGMLDRLNDDELATLYAAELGHITHYTTGVLSWVTLVMQLPYWVYWSVASWGNRQRDRVLQSLAVLVSSIAYGIYWVCRLAGLWLSRARQYYGDRAATELTGNPNGLTRALLKTAIGIAQDIQQQTSTHPLLESFDLLLPIGHQGALTLGSLYPHTPTPTLLEWDHSHRYRRWLALNNSHPPLGDRLNLLTLYAGHWRLEPELEMGNRGSEIRDRELEQNSFRALLLQGSPFFGGLFGLLVAGCLWLIGWIAYVYRWSLLDWIWLDRRIILTSCLLLGFGIGLLLRINSAYPDLKRSTTSNLNLVDLLSNPNAMPIDKMPVRMQGYLMGRQKFLNRFYQDLVLQTQTGLIRLHYTSRGGFLGNLLSQSRRPTEWLNRDEPVTVTGWFRRGATPWLDVDTIQTKRGTTVRSGHPTWSTIVAIGCALLGIFVLFRG
jgi:Zn-dependent protease with chaperone function